MEVYSLTPPLSGWSRGVDFSGSCPVNFEYFEEWRFYSLSQQSVPVFDHLHREKKQGNKQINPQTPNIFKCNFLKFSFFSLCCHYEPLRSPWLWCLYFYFLLQAWQSDFREIITSLGLLALLSLVQYSPRCRLPRILGNRVWTPDFSIYFHCFGCKCHPNWLYVFLY